MVSIVRRAVSVATLTSRTLRASAGPAGATPQRLRPAGGCRPRAGPGPPRRDGRGAAPRAPRATSAAWPWITAPTSRCSSSRWKPISRPSASEPRSTHSTAGSTSPSTCSLRPKSCVKNTGTHVVRGASARQLAAEVRTLRVRVRPVLDPPQAPRRGVGIPRDVADRVHVRERGAEALVDDDPVVDLRPGLLGELDVGDDADPDDREVALERPAVVRARAGQEPSVARQLLELRPEQHVDALRAVELERAPPRAPRPASCGISVSPASTSVTSRPRMRSDAAVSDPMKLPPITIAEWASSAARLTVSASASVR